MTDQGISIVMPVYNEIATIQEILRRVLAVGIEKEIIIVDDGSTDGTREFLRALGRRTAKELAPRGAGVPGGDNIRVFFQDTNRGKGAALRRGFQEARGAIIIIQDGDLETNPADYPQLIAPIQAGKADVVYGTRFPRGASRPLSDWHYLGNKWLTMASNLVTNLNLTDVWTCYKVFRREVLQDLDLCENRFGFEQEFTIKIAQAGWRIDETPVSYCRRSYAEGKKIRSNDALRALWCILRYGLPARLEGTRRQERAA